jgi:hypothetical protein
MMASAMEKSCINSLNRRKVSNAREVTKHMWEVFGVEVSEVILYHVFCKVGLQLHEKEKKPCL